MGLKTKTSIGVIVQACGNRVEGAGRVSDPRLLPNLIFYELKQMVEKSEMLKNYKLLENPQTFMLFVTLLKSSRLEVFCKKGVLKNFAKLTGKHLC